MGTKLSANMTENLTWLQTALGNSPDLITRLVVPERIAVAFLVELVDYRMIQEGVIAPLQARPDTSPPALKDLAAGVVQAPGYACLTDRDQVITHLFRGFTAIFVDGHAEALLVATQGGEQRTPDEPPSEPAVRGPRIGFVESLDTNRSLIRRRLTDPALRIETMTLGQNTGVRVDVFHLEGKAPPDLVTEVRQRLKRIQTNGVLDAGTIGEFIEDSPWSPFPQILSTERPDRVVACLITGKVVIMCDGSPTALLTPSVFWDFLEVPEDYYERWWAATLVRMIRALSVFLSFTLPALWVSLTVFHQELLPTPLALSVAGGRERIPLPAVLEALVLEFAFEVLREAGARLPRSWGQATSIVGGLVIGQAAVQAGLVSPSMVIIIATTGLASFATPAFSAAYAFRILRFGILGLAGSFGVLGFGFGLMLIVLHMLHLKSFGAEYLSPVLPLMPKGADDVLVRAPWPVMKSIGTRWWKR